MFAVGRARIQVSFTGGHLGDGCQTPAKYSTSDPVVQRVIESSAAYAAGRIRLGASFPEPEPKPGSEPKPEPKPAQVAQPEKTAECPVFTQEVSPALNRSKPVDVNEFEFEDLESLQDFLNSKKGVAMSKLNGKENCIKEANHLGFRVRLRNDG